MVSLFIVFKVKFGKLQNKIKKKDYTLFFLLDKSGFVFEVMLYAQFISFIRQTLYGARDYLLGRMGHKRSTYIILNH